MSYFSNSPSGNNPLSFPSYNQRSIQQRAISGLGAIDNSVNHLQNQFNEPTLNSGLHDDEAAADDQGSFVTPGDEVRSIHGGSINPSASNRQQEEFMRKRSNSEKSHSKRDRRNRPGQKFGAKKRLWVWTWFVQDPDDQNVAICDFCGKVITRVASDRGLPKKLSEHLHTHKLTKILINPSRSIDASGMALGNSSIQLPFTGEFARQSNPDIAQNPDSSIGQTQVDLNSAPQQTLQQQLTQILTLKQHPQIQNTRILQTQSNAESLSENKHGAAKYRRAIAMTRFSPETQQIHSQIQKRMTLPVTSNQNPPSQYNRRFILSNFEDSPYSGSKFHRHLLKFLTENKLSIRLLTLHSFQQLIYDLRPESISDLLDLTGLYSSFVEIARTDTLSDGDGGRDATIAEANVVNTLAQELIKK